MKTPEFSAIITAHNKARYIREAIDSVLSQTYPDFEIIVVDDGSTDNTRHIVSSYKDSRISYFYQEHSGLPAKCRNKGMSLSIGKYIAFLDGDDFWDRGKLEKCKAALDSSPEAGLACHNEAVIHNGRLMRRTSYGPSVQDMYRRLILVGNCLHASAVVMRRGLYFDKGFKFSEEKNLFAIEDYEFWIRLSKACRFLFMPEALGYYRVTDEGIFIRNPESNTLNMLGMLDPHFAKLDSGDRHIRRKVRQRRSQVMCGAGRVFHHRRLFKEGRRWYASAIREDPLNYKPYICFLAALARIRIIYR